MKTKFETPTTELALGDEAINYEFMENDPQSHEFSPEVGDFAGRLALQAA